MKKISLVFRLFISVVMFSFFTSCTIESLQLSSAGSEIVLSIPGTEDVDVRSAATSSECYIYNAAVLSVDEWGFVTGAEYVTSITDNGSTTPSLKLKSLDPGSGETLHVICNFDPSVTASTVNGLASGSTTLSEAQNILTGKTAYTNDDNNTTAELETPLLMYGSGSYGGGYYFNDLPGC